MSVCARRARARRGPGRRHAVEDQRPPDRHRQSRRPGAAGSVAAAARASRWPSSTASRSRSKPTARRSRTSRTTRASRACRPAGFARGLATSRELTDEGRGTAAPPEAPRTSGQRRFGRRRCRQRARSAGVRRPPSCRGRSQSSASVDPQVADRRQRAQSRIDVYAESRLIAAHRAARRPRAERPPACRSRSLRRGGSADIA